MKCTPKKTLLAVWVLLASVTLTYTWYYNPNAFPQIPEHFAGWLTDVAAAKTAEDVALVSISFGLVISFFLVAFFTFIAIKLVRALFRAS